jgi:hypothetical protein
MDLRESKDPHVPLLSTADLEGSVAPVLRLSELVGFSVDSPMIVFRLVSSRPGSLRSYEERVKAGKPESTPHAGGDLSLDACLALNT